MPRINRFAALFLLTGALAPVTARGQKRQDLTTLAREVANAGVTTRVLMIGAHPDDEDSALLAWLAAGGHADAAYLSLTRGEGGQNFIGDERGDLLGVVRTEELLAARRADGAHQFSPAPTTSGSRRAPTRRWPTGGATPCSATSSR